MDSPIGLDKLALRLPAIVHSIAWDRLAAPEAKRLRELGMGEGAEVEVLHRARIGGGPIACRIGRMTVAMRRGVAGAILVADSAAAAAE